MDLYFAPLACSMATRIALYETGGEARYRCVDTKTRRLDDGSDFLVINPLGQVPVLRTDDGDVIMENSAILQYVADRTPDSGLAPQGGSIARYRLQQWLNFITSELHKVVFIPLLKADSPEGAKVFARDCAGPRLDYLDRSLDGRAFIMDRFTVADAYLVTVLNWSRASKIDLTRWPAVTAYFDRMQTRPSIARALSIELALYQDQQARRGAA